MIPAVAAGVAAGVYRGAVDDYIGQPYYNDSSESPHLPIMLPDISEHRSDDFVDDHEYIEDTQPPATEFADGQNDG